MHRSLVMVLKTGPTPTTNRTKAMEFYGLVPILADNARAWELILG